MKVRDCFDVNPSKNTNKHTDFINYIDTSSVKAGCLENVTYLEEDFPSRAQRIIKKGDILYSSVRPNLKHYYFYFDDIEHAVASTGFVLLREKSSNKQNAKFIYYFLSTQQIVDYLSGIAELSQATFPSFSSKDLGKIDLPNFSREKQDKIVDIISKYDFALDNNNRRIRILEKMAEDLYKEWFVRFRFPGHDKIGFQKSKIGKIPANFEVLKMQDVFDFYIGGGWGNDYEDNEFSQGAYVIRGADFPYVTNGDLSSCPFRYHKKSNYSSRQIKDGDIIIEVSGGTAEQPVGRAVLVNQDMIDRFGGTVICASFCKLVRLKKSMIRPEYFYYWMKFLYDTRIIDRFQLQSTGIINFKFESFVNKGEVLMPPYELMNKFSDYIKVLNDEINLIARKNENLIKQRELLLPRLMSGKIQL